jgi:hypothetical protein
MVRRRMNRGARVFSLTVLLVIAVILASCTNAALQAIIDAAGVGSEIPAPGNSGTLVINAPDSSGDFSVDWVSASDGQDASSTLSYMVLTSDSGNIGNLDDALSNGTDESGWLTGAGTFEITGKTPGYLWVNVMVRDSDGNRAVYTQNAAPPMFVLEFYDPLIPGYDTLTVGGDISSLTSVKILDYQNSAFPEDENTVQFRITNEGYSDMNISTVALYDQSGHSDKDDFAVATQPITASAIVPGDTRSFILEYTSRYGFGTQDYFYVSLGITSNDPGPQRGSGTHFSNVHVYDYC